jgi:hypothetical protein
MTDEDVDKTVTEITSVSSNVVLNKYENQSCGRRVSVNNSSLLLKSVLLGYYA